MEKADTDYLGFHGGRSVIVSDSPLPSNSLAVSPTLTVTERFTIIRIMIQKDVSSKFRIASSNKVCLLIFANTIH